MHGCTALEMIGGTTLTLFTTMIVMIMNIVNKTGLGWQACGHLASDYILKGLQKVQQLPIKIRD